MSDTIIVEARGLPERGYWAAGKFWGHGGEVHEITRSEFLREIKDEPRLVVMLVAPDRQSYDDAKQLIAELREQCEQAVQAVVADVSAGKPVKRKGKSESESDPES